jgi:hypothetical protein
MYSGFVLEFFGGTIAAGIVPCTRSSNRQVLAGSHMLLHTHYSQIIITNLEQKRRRNGGVRLDRLISPHPVGPLFISPR